MFSDFYGTYQKEVAPLEVVLSTLEGVASSLAVGPAAVGASGLEDPSLGPHTWVGASSLGVVPWVAFLKHKQLYLFMLWMEISDLVKHNTFFHIYTHQRLALNEPILDQQGS